MSQPPGQPNSPSWNASEPRFLIRLEPRLPSLLSNIGALLRRPQAGPAGAPFWPDVFVATGLPWRSLAESGLSHGLMLAAIWGLTHALLSRPRIVLRPRFQPSQIVYYTTSEYLPAIKSVAPRGRMARPAEPALARQEIISVPPEADNHSQTVVTPPDVQLAQQMPLPNLVAWTRDPGPVPVPSSLNSKLTAPALATAVVPPPPEIARAGERAAPALPQPAAVAPPPDTASILPRALALAPRPAVVQPPPEVALAERPALPALPQAAVVVPAPETTSALAQLRLPPAGPMRAVPPPPATETVVSGRPAGQVVALGVSPAAVTGPITVPAGNRRGVFAAGPSGRAGASALPGSSSGGAAEAGTGSANPARDKLAGISIAPGPTSPPAAESAVVAATPAHNLWAMAHIPAGLRNLPPRLHGDLPASPSAIDRQVFGNKKFYSVTLNMPNLNSRSGSWVIRFAELNEDRQQGPLTAPVVLEKVDPAYPGILMREHVEGTVTLYAVIGADGSVAGVRVLHGVDDRLDAAARDALEHCRFRPATKNGLAVALEAVIRIPFEVHRIPY